jgi:hypothetical protein
MSPAQRGRAASGDGATDPRLRSRVYAIPFEQVWQAALRLAGGRLRGWSTVHADDHEGTITAVARGLAGAEHDVLIRIGLDADAQTVVEAEVTARKPGSDLGRAGRRLRRFLCALDAAAAPAANRPGLVERLRR